MTHFPHRMAFVLTTNKENHMFDFDTMNKILDELAEAGIVEPMVEPIDEPSCHPLDWAEVVGVVDEMIGEIYPEAEYR